jgi:GrpB-like predicted nucleotidyltransferase (UPF0157 family)
MPAPIPVDLQPYSPEWPDLATREIQRLTPAFGENLVTIHHIGSTAIPGISAKPILDLMPVVQDIAALDGHRASIEAFGFEWWGEFGIPGRRYCTLTDPATSLRKVQLHSFEQNSPQIERHLAFRDYLNARPDLAREYDALKAHCRDLHPLNTHAYTDCKNPWIRTIEAGSIAFFRSRLTR